MLRKIKAKWDNLWLASNNYLLICKILYGHTAQ